jgi:hypothetical protein
VSVPEPQVQPPKDRTFEFSLWHLTGDRRGSEERFVGDRVSIGRGRNNHCSFDPEKERSVSHRHCEIRVEDQTAFVYDIGSLNGTYLNGRRVRRAPLADGDEIGLGREGPRLRFSVRSGELADPLRAQNHQLGGTSQEPQPVLGTASLPQPALQERQRWRATILGIVILVVLGAGGWCGEVLLDRIETLESSQTPDGTKSPAPSQRTGEETTPSSEGGTNSAVGQALASQVVELYGCVRNRWGQSQTYYERLGWGGMVTPASVVTTYDVFQKLRVWLRLEVSEPGATKEIIAAPDGRPELGATVEAFVLHPEAMTGDWGNLALLLLPEDCTLPRAALADPPVDHVRFRLPRHASVSLQVREISDGSRTAVRRPEQAVFLRFEVPEGGMAPPAGMPLFSGSEIVALSLGPHLSGWAITARPMRDLLKVAATATPELLPSEPLAPHETRPR